ncbi:hypothetical protein GCM10010492_59700 [Saccharothrix mutabilis subsp. mutabilis]|uniref:Peptidase C14 caspase domain-containing protein n=1 Tax=Saccharothrix mutabilis subsp. mutabilis TaxID=66855 RepID=A0ABN0UI44_9PSEU
MIVATGEYADPTLRRLRAPAHDAADMADVLEDPRIGGFSVRRLVDRPHHEVKVEVERHLAARTAGELVVVYLSCHGILDRRGRLYLATTDTDRDLPASTSVEADWLRERLEDCPADQVVILDCCFGGAYAATKGGTEVDLDRRFLGNGRGRVVLTASRAWEYSFEGTTLVTDAPVRSVFTAGLVDGLRTGRADRDGDGYVTVDEAFLYASEHVAAGGGDQTPQRWAYAAEGALVLARNPGRVVVTPDPARPDGALPGIIRTWRTVTAGYDVQQVNTGIVELTAAMAASPAPTAPFFPIVGRGATGYDREQVDAYVLAHRPEPTTFTEGLRTLLRDNGRLLADSPPLASDAAALRLRGRVRSTAAVLARVLLRNSLLPGRRAWAFFTTEEIALHAGGWTTVPYRDVGALRVTVEISQELYAEDMFTAFERKSRLTIDFADNTRVLPSQPVSLVNDALFAHLVHGVQDLRKTHAQEFDPRPPQP